MISYAQNFEDVMLWRALNHIENGFYIDVGANHPVIDSVTKAFYDRGWRGINIEPIEQHFLELQNDRPNDINLKIAISNHKGKEQLIVPNVRGWATLDIEMKQRYSSEQYPCENIEVEITTLNDIWEQHIKLNTEVHFLKIDVENYEKQVLEGLDLKQYRPWIVVIESTIPNSQIENHKKWIYLLLDNQYKMVYFDGLNRFFCADEHKELKKFFKSPPNVFDNFVRYGEYRAVAMLDSLKEQLKHW